MLKLLATNRDLCKYTIIKCIIIIYNILYIKLYVRAHTYIAIFVFK